MAHHTHMRGHSLRDPHHTARTLAEPYRPVTVGRLLHRRLALATIAAALALMPTACAFKGVTMAAVTAMTLHGDGTLAQPTPETAARPNTGTLAFTYNPQLAPPGAHISVLMAPHNESTTAEMTVSGLLPNRGYAAHANVNACSPNPAAEGPTYQNRIDPAVNTKAIGQQRSTNPEYANPQNEVWLDVRTDGSGSGTSRVTLPFVFTDRGPGAVVLYDGEQTNTAPGQVGQAGNPIACVSLSAVQPREHPRGSAS
jgi:Cu-Zn family superoxide dismutase